jgi:mRNA-degrading endonuclease RelE of RelBE toxin-antitoxin system
MMPFEVRVTTRFDRELKQLSAGHADLPKLYAATLPILQDDPYNRTRSHAVKKLAGVGAGDGQYASGPAVSDFGTTSPAG